MVFTQHRSHRCNLPPGARFSIQRLFHPAFLSARYSAKICLGGDRSFQSLRQIQLSQVKAPNILQQLSSRLLSEPAGSINLMAREGTVTDIPQWCALHQSLGVPYPAAARGVLAELWRILLSTGRLLLFLVEDRWRPRGARIVSCCAAIFATDAFVAEARSTLRPFLGMRLAQHYLEGELSVLSASEIARANAAEGLNLVVCFEGWDTNALPREEWLAVRERQCTAFHVALSGYHLKEFLANPLGQEAFEEMIDAGARLRRDYAEFFQPETPLPPLQPRLVGLTKAEAEAHPGSHLAGLFVYTPPRFHFSRAEQRLLQHALTGETCDDLSNSLALSRWTVKKRWHAIYEKVAAADSELLPPLCDGQDPHGRGAERRRRLLNYLRQHPEELRPARRTQPRNSLQPGVE